MDAVNTKKLETVSLFHQIIIKFSVNFKGAICLNKRNQVLTSQKIDKIRSRTVNITFESHHMTTTAPQFYSYVQNWVVPRGWDYFGINV